MNNWGVYTKQRMTILLLILVLSLDIGGAGTLLAIGAAEAHGQHIDVLAGP